YYFATSSRLQDFCSSLVSFATLGFSLYHTQLEPLYLAMSFQKNKAIKINGKGANIYIITALNY
ncbi:MAG: hypothetical protein C4323_07155, partial [Mastigocladus sp. ERB_26_2]